MTCQPITAVILAGGLGTRLRPSIADRPKALAPIADRPFLSHLLDQLVAAQIHRVVLCTGHRHEQIEAEYGDSYAAGTLQLRYSRELHPLGTAGALRQAMRYVETDQILVMNGDSYCEADLNEFYRWTIDRGSRLALVTTELDEVQRFGQLQIDATTRLVEQFTEKGHTHGRGWINAGIYCLSSALIRSLPHGSELSLEHDVFPEFCATELLAWPTAGRFIDIGTPSSLAAAQHFFATARAGLLILDRDGTLIEDQHYLADPQQVELLPGVAAGLRKLRAAGYQMAVVTNQSGIGRGYYETADYEAVNQRMLDLLAVEEVHIEGIWHCPHRPEERCACRKPAAGMLKAAASALGYRPGECLVVGDKDCDIDLGNQAGARTVLVRTGYGAATEQAHSSTPDLVVDGLLDLAEMEGRR